jgi:hypothetical protein
MPKKVTLDPSVGIDPIPTGAGGIVRGAIITVKGTAKCIKETFDTAHPEDPTTEDSPGSIAEVAAAARRVVLCKPRNRPTRRSAWQH